MSFHFDDIPAAIYDTFIVEQFGNFAMVEKPQYYNFVCPNCGDMKFPNKKKAYVYKDKWLYKCYKCGTSTPFAMHLKQADPDAYRRLLFSAFGNEYGHQRKKDPPLVQTHKTMDLPFMDGELVPITDPADPLAVAGRSLCASRMIREEVYSDWFVCRAGDQFYRRDQYGNILRDQATGHPIGNEYKNRIIIPFYRFGGRWNQFDARAIDQNNPLRYRNFTGVKRIAYNIDFVNFNEPFYILEGTIDSTFIRNSIAIGGIQHLSDIMADNPDIARHADNCIMIWDNDIQGNKARWDTCNAGYKWFDWEGISSKDINGAVMSGELPLDEDGYVDQEAIRARTRMPGAANILFMMKYGNVAKREYKERTARMNDAKQQRAKTQKVEVLF